MTRVYYTDFSGAVAGPVSIDELRQFVASGLVPQESQFCPEGTEDWRPAKELPRRRVLSQPQTSGASPIKLFAAVFLALIAAGGVLMVGWRALTAYGSPSASTKISVFEKRCTLSGDVFIVTQGGQSYKLGLVTIGITDLDAAKAAIGRRRIEIGPELDSLERQIKASDSSDEREKLETKRNRLLYGINYFKDIPPLVAETKTDADGRFSIVVPASKPVAIYATASRLVGEFPEFYHWIIRVPLNGESEHKVMLSNDNQTNHESSESLILTL